MKITTRAALMSGIATVAASAVVIAPSVQPLPSPKPAIQLTAVSQMLAQQQQQLLEQQPRLLLVRQVNSAAETRETLAAVLLAPGIGTPPPSPSIPPVPAPTSVASVIESAYLAIEPWVSYGFEVGAWAFSWVPFVGWLAPQIWPIGYNLGERLVGSAVFNFTDFLQGQGGIITNVVDWGVEAVDALVQFGIDQWNFWIGFPLPPLPFDLAATEAPTTLSTVAAPLEKTADPARDVLDRVTSPIKNSISFGTGALRDVLEGIPSGVEAQPGPQTVEEVADDAGGATLATRIRDRINQAVRPAVKQHPVGNEVVRAQGEVRGPVGRAVTDVVDALRAGKPNKDADEGTTPRTVTNSLGDTARNAVSNMRQTAKDVRQTAKDARQAAKDARQSAKEQRSGDDK